jgi:hypothetical protein
LQRFYGPARPSTTPADKRWARGHWRISARRWAAVTLLTAVAILAAAAQPCAAEELGRVTDSYDGKPIAGAIVTLGDHVVHSDSGGLFRVESGEDEVGVRAYGYLRTEVPIAKFTPNATLDVPLKSFRPKALYLSFFGVGHRGLREAALSLIERTELNAVVIDVKGDRGMIAFKSGIPLGSQIGAQSLITVPDMKGLIAALHARGIYSIARIVVFKDTKLASARPDFAVKTAHGAIYHDRENLEWTNPYLKQVRDYNIAVAVEAAKYGFDEIQFDYVRLPDVRGGRLDWPGPNTEANRVEPINAFLREARAALVPYNVFVAADVFGYVCWNLDDTKIGQQLNDIAETVDYISPMLYPSGFQFGIPGYRNPVANVYQIVHLSLLRAQQRTGLPPVRFRPWLQAFRDYAFDHRRFGADQIRQQIDAAGAFGSDGWMLWNPNNRYSDEGLKSRGGAPAPLP